MKITREIEKQGEWLFQWRSILPLLVVPVLAAVYMQQAQTTPAAGWAWMCLGLSLLGLGTRILAVGCAPAGTSGRNTRSQIAEQLNKTGAYSVVRHPLYVGNFLAGLGVAAALANIGVVAVFTLAFWLYYERIAAAEEEFLERRFGGGFRDWCATTPAFVPNPWRWTRASLPFSVRTVLKREYTGLLVVVALHTIVQAYFGSNSEGRISLGLPWQVAFLCSTGTYLLLRALKKHTRILSVPGR